MKKLVVVLAILMLLAACGGGGSGDDTSYAEKTFIINPPESYLPGYKTSFSLSGKDDRGERWSILSSSAVRGTTILFNETVFVSEQLFIMTFRETTTSELVTTYFRENHDPVYMIDQSGNAYAPVKISNTPTTATVGDFGAQTSWKDNNGNTTTGTWNLEKAHDGLANLVFVSTYRDASGNTEFYQEMVITIDESGDEKLIYLKWHYPNTGRTIEVSGNRIYDT